jgi:hypothetical protein
MEDVRRIYMAKATKVYEPTLADKAQFMLNYQNYISLNKKLYDQYEKEFLEAGKDRKFKEIGVQVNIVPGNARSEISDDIFDKLTKAELKKVAKVSSTALKENGMESLIKDYKIDLGRKMTVKVSEIAEKKPAKA